MWRLLRLAAGAVAVAATAGCALTQEAMVTPPDRGTIGIVLPNSKSDRWNGDGRSMVEQFELLGYRTDLRFGEDDVNRQIGQLREMIGAGDKALVVGSINGGALTAVLAEAAAKDIPVIAYDRLIRDTPNVDYYATFDNFRVGVLQANYIVKALNLAAGGSYSIELFAGSADDNNARFFFNGAMSVLQPYLGAGRLRVLSGETGFDQIATMRWDGAVAKTRMQRLLAGPYAGRRVDAVLSPYDGISRGVIEALEAAGYGQLPVVTGQDAELQSVKLIAAGKQSETVYKDTRELAKAAVQITNSLLTGGTPEVNDTTQYHNGVKAVPAFLLQPVDVDRSNYQRVLVDGGYYTAAQLAG